MIIIIIIKIYYYFIYLLLLLSSSLLLLLLFIFIKVIKFLISLVKEVLLIKIIKTKGNTSISWNSPLLSITPKRKWRNNNRIW